MQDGATVAGYSDSDSEMDLALEWYDMVAEPSTPPRPYDGTRLPFWP
jgi:hypothetical protein